MSIEELSAYGNLDAIEVPDGYAVASIPDLTRDNICHLVNKVNELVEEVNRLRSLVTPLE